MPSDLYAVQESINGYVKIGRSGNVDARIGQLRTGSPGELTLVLHAPGCGFLEHALHRLFAEHHVTNEWFRPEGSVIDFLRAAHETQRFRPRLACLLMTLGQSLVQVSLQDDGRTRLEAGAEALRICSDRAARMADLIEVELDARDRRASEYAAKQKDDPEALQTAVDIYESITGTNHQPEA